MLGEKERKAAKKKRMQETKGKAAAVASVQGSSSSSWSGRMAPSMVGEEVDGKRGAATAENGLLGNRATNKTRVKIREFVSLSTLAPHASSQFVIPLSHLDGKSAILIPKCLR